MREILFRGKSTDTGAWVYGYYCGPFGDFDEHEICDIADPTCSRVDVVPETVGQYTGLKDKNGKRIFEGDILDVSGNPDAVLLGYRNGRAIVRWDEDVSGFEPFAYYDSDCGLYICEKECVVIGNIHDNPELIGGKDDA